MPVSREHKKPTTPKEVKESEKVAKHMYASLTEPKAPRATSTGYIMAACSVLKILMDQAEAQGADKESLKQQAIKFIEEV